MIREIREQTETEVTIVTPDEIQRDQMLKALQDAVGSHDTGTLKGLIGNKPFTPKK